MSKPQHALTVLASTELVAKDEQLEELKNAAVSQFAAVAKMESNAARGGIICGLTLHRLKASLPHGKFRPFVEQMLPWGNISTPATRIKTASFLMRLAAVFIDTSKVSKPDILALPGDPLTLSLDDNFEGQRFMEKLNKFAGNRSLNELLIKYDIKSVGLKKDLEKEKGDDGDEPPQPPTAEELYEKSRDEIGLVILQAENLFLKEGRLAYLIGHSEELKGISKSFTDLAKAIAKQVEELEGKAEAITIPPAEDMP